MEFLLVGLGGALGAMGRYGISLLPWGGTFPLLTLLTNFLGASRLRQGSPSGGGVLSPGWVLFWKTGVCGGFTTFSTFSLETLNLVRQGRWGLGTLYAVLSVGLCLGGVWCGLRLAAVLQR